MQHANSRKVEMLILPKVLLEANCMAKKLQQTNYFNQGESFWNKTDTRTLLNAS